MKALRLALLFLLLPFALRAQSIDSKEIYRRASTQPKGSRESIALYTRYVKLEPADAWGHLALAESLAAAGRFAEAKRSLERAERLAPGEADVKITRQRIDRLHRNRAASVQPRIGITFDTDANRLIETRLAADISSSASARFGVIGSFARTSDGANNFTAQDGRIVLQQHTSAARFELAAGGTRTSSTTDFSTLAARARLRWSASPKGARVDVRVNRAPLLLTPLLMVNHVVLNEARGTIELPLAGPLRVRGNAQFGDLASDNIDTVTFIANNGGSGRRRRGGAGTPITTRSINATTSHNQRVGYGGGLVARIGTSSEIGGSYYQLSYRAQATTGYFAPRQAQTLQVGTYSEIYRFDPVTISFDVGAGVERVRRFDGSITGWSPAYHGWGLLTIPLARATELNFEAEAYRSQIGTVTTGTSWSSYSGALFVKWLPGY